MTTDVLTHNVPSFKHDSELRISPYANSLIQVY